VELSTAYAGSYILQDTEQDVVQRWCNGDKKAFEILVKRYMADAYLTALGFTGNADDAKDLSQDAFVKAFKARRQFDPKRPFYPWFYRILKNHCLNFLQRVKKKPEPLYYDEALDSERFASRGPTPLEDLEKDERIRLVRAAINQLSLEHREVIILKNFRGLSYREMAEELDTPIGTVMSRLYYARRMLKEIITVWEREGVPDDSRPYPRGHESPGEVA
jgi:RNA polymerase sigma-70 factor (ECF subfamily)